MAPRKVTHRSNTRNYRNIASRIASERVRVAVAINRDERLHEKSRVRETGNAADFSQPDLRPSKMYARNLPDTDKLHVHGEMAL